MRINKGFSLVELLVVVALLGGLAVATSRVFFANIRGSEKTQSLVELRQAGDQALLTMKKKIRNSREITSSCSSGMSFLTIRSRDPAVTGLASTASITTQFTCGDRIMMSEDTGADIPLTPDPVVTNIQVQSCSFSCVQAPGNPGKVAINFTLVTADSKEQLGFDTVVSLRNF